jgi:glucose-6-phosphate dehydrogenase assembly protein OpcA
MATDLTAPRPVNEPVLRFSSHVHSIAEIETQLAKIWAGQDLTAEVEGAPGRHIAARTSVLNLVVIARRPEIAERAATTIQALTGRHPSRTIVVQSADPDGPSWIDARIEAHCILPREDAPETCAETIHLVVGGEAGRHLATTVAPLIIHDLPVTVWWPGEPPFRALASRDVLANADRLVVDGSSWSGDGLERLRDLAAVAAASEVTVSDFALVRQSRWREAIASVFDDPDFLPYLPWLRRIAVTYATHDETGAPGSTNLVKPVYHVAWLASRLGLSVRRPLAPVGGPATTPKAKAKAHHPAPGRQVVGRGLHASLANGHGEVGVVVRPRLSPMPGGTTLRVELLAERRGSELRADVTAEAETVHVRVWQDGVEALDRLFLAARRTDTELLGEILESGLRDPVGKGALQAAAELVGGDDAGAGPA